MYRVTLRFYEELNDFLPRERRKRSFDVSCPEARSVKDLIESVGIPHTEVDLILANGDPVGFGHRVVNGDRIAVYPVFEALELSGLARLGRPPLREPRFLADVHLGTLARLLRLLGLDCAFDRRLDDRELAARSAREGRILLSRDRGLLKRREVTHGICIRSTEPEEQAGEVMRRVQLEERLRPYTRCVNCGGKLNKVSKESVWDRIPPRTRRHTNVYHQCEACRQVFWPGSHFGALKKKVERLRAKARKTAPASDVNPRP